MTERTEQIIIDVEFNVGETEAKLGSVTQKIKELKDANKGMKDELKGGSTNFAELSTKIAANEAEIKSLTAAEKELSGMISVATKERRIYSDSFKGQSAQLADLKNQYSSLSKAERESAGGQEMLKHLADLDKQVKENDKSMGNFQRNVADYPKEFDLSGTAIGKFQSMLQGLGGNATSVGSMASNAFGAIKTQAISLGKAFLTPPIGLIVVILGAIMIAVTKVVEAFKKNDEASDKLEKAFSVLAPIGTAISFIFDKLATILANLAVGFSKVLNSVLNLIPGYKDASKAAGDLVDAQQRLEDQENNYTVNSAKRNAQIAKLKKEAVNTQKYTTKQIEDMLIQADNLEQQNMKENLANKALALKNIKQKAAEEVTTNQETQKKIAEARAAFFNAETEYTNGTLRLATKINSAREKQAAEAKKQSDEAATRLSQQTEAQKQAAATALEINRQLNDAILQSRKDGVAKDIEIEKENTRRQIEDIQKRIDTDKNLTEKAKSDLIALQIQLQTNSDAKVKQMQADATQEKLDKDIEAEQKRISLLLEVAEKGSQNELNLRKRAIENLRRQELNNTELTLSEKTLINLKYDNQLEEANKQSIQRKEQARKQALENEFNDLKLRMDISNASALQIAQAEQEQAQIEAANIILLDSETKAALYENQAAYDAAVIESKSKVVKASQAVIDAEQKQLESQIAMAQGFGNAISSVLSEVAGNNKDALVFQKMIALANVSLSLAEAIAAATASSTKGDPYTMALRIATNVASVVVAFSQVTKAIKATQIPSQPKFANGGIVGGSSYTGDNITARVNSGEMIFNYEQQKKLFDLVANSNFSGGSGIDYELLAKAMGRQPAPILNYKEFTDFQQKIVTFDEHIKL